MKTRTVQINVCPVNRLLREEVMHHKPHALAHVRWLPSVRVVNRWRINILNDQAQQRKGTRQSQCHLTMRAADIYHHGARREIAPCPGANEVIHAEIGASGI